MHRHLVDHWLSVRCNRRTHHVDTCRVESSTWWIANRFGGNAGIASLVERMKWTMTCWHINGRDRSKARAWHHNVCVGYDLWWDCVRLNIISHDRKSENVSMPPKYGKWPSRLWVQAPQIEQSAPKINNINIIELSMVFGDNTESAVDLAIIVSFKISSLASINSTTLDRYS